MERNDQETGDVGIARHFAAHYSKLKSIARAKLAGESYQVTIQATALVHDAFIRLTKSARNQRMSHTGYFMASYIETLKRILIDRAIRRKRVKHGGHMSAVEMDCAQIPAADTPHYWEQINELMPLLEQSSPRVAQVVHMKLNQALEDEVIAEKLKINRRTVQRVWQIGKAWLMDRVSDHDG